MPKVEILAYCQRNIKEFDSYVVNGLKGSDGNPLLDEYGRKITGVMKWLHGRGISQARFFSTDPNEPSIQFFVAAIVPHEHEGEEEVPWMKNVPGFERMVRVDGLIGHGDDFPAGESTPLAGLRPRPDLDQLFEQEQQRIAELDFSKLDFTREEFLAALKGKQGTNLRDLLLRINETFKTNLMPSFLE